MTVLMHACATGNSERVRQCLESLQGESADQKEALELELTATDDWAGSSPLHWAAFSGNARVVEMLLKVGAKVNAHNQRDGSLPIHLAARYGKSAALVALADDRKGRLCVNTLNHLGNTPLHECAYEGRAEGAGHLLNRGAKLEIANRHEKGGLTPLLAAIEYGHLAVVQVLLRQGADMHAAPLDTSAIKPRSSRLRNSNLSTPTLKRFRTDISGVRLTRRSMTRMNIPPLTRADSALGGLNRRFHVEGEPAITLALAVSHLDVVLELLMWRLRKGNGPPLLFSIRQLKAIVFDIWAVEGNGQASIDTQRFTRLFTVLILCTKPTLPHHGTHIDRAAHASGSKGGFGNSSGGGGEGGDSGGGGGGGGPHSDGPMPVPVPPVLPQRFFSAGARIRSLVRSRRSEGSNLRRRASPIPSGARWLPRAQPCPRTPCCWPFSWPPSARRRASARHATGSCASAWATPPPPLSTLRAVFSTVLPARPFRRKSASSTTRGGWAQATSILRWRGISS